MRFALLLVLLCSCDSTSTLWLWATNHGTVYKCVDTAGDVKELCWDGSVVDLQISTGRGCSETDRAWPQLFGCSYCCGAGCPRGCNATSGCYCP